MKSMPSLKIETHPVPSETILHSVTIQRVDRFGLTLLLLELSTDEAREMAAELLAAADYADQMKRVNS